MRKPLIRLLLAATVSGLSGGCADSHYSARVPYTDRLLQELDIPLEARPALQYYLSRDVHLVRARVRGDSGVRQGRVISGAEREFEEVTIERGTPGVAVGMGRDWLAISFSPGTYLYFVSRPQQHEWLYDGEAVSGRYYLYSRDWKWDSGTVWLGDRSYQAVDGSRGAFLLIEREQLERSQTRRQLLPGRWLHRDGDWRPRGPY